MSTKLKSIKITGFKEANRQVQLDFSNEPITVIFGENGSGKTTLLKIIHAVFSKNEEYLIEENVKEVELTYSTNLELEKKILVKISNKKVNWGDNIKDLTKTTSVLFGVNRGVISEEADFGSSSRELDYLRARGLKVHYELENAREILRRYSDTAMHNMFTGDWYKKNHLSVDLIGITSIEEAIVRQARIGQRATSDKVKNAFFNTISSAVDIEMRQDNYQLPYDFMERIENKRAVLLPLIEKLDKSSLQSKLLNYINNNNESAEIVDSKIFRAMLVNILEKVEEENIDLKSISELINIFNNHLYRDKRLVVTDDEAFIEFANSKRHKLEKLSSGERHLLTFLTLFLIIARGRDFFIIDEPEISLNMKWQRELLPLLSELSPKSQIIVATHSPSISNRNSNYLVELV